MNKRKLAIKRPTMLLSILNTVASRSINYSGYMLLTVEYIL